MSKSFPSDRDNTNKDKKEDGESGDDKDGIEVDTVVVELDQKNKSLCIFEESNSIRTLMSKIEKSSYFQNGILFMIIISSIALAFENPLTDPESTEATILIKLDIILTVVFALEVVIKVISHGFLFNGSHSYLREFWNILDFIVVIVAIISLSMP